MKCRFHNAPTVLTDRSRRAENRKLCCLRRSLHQCRHLQGEVSNETIHQSMRYCSCQQSHSQTYTVNTQCTRMLHNHTPIHRYGILYVLIQNLIKSKHFMLLFIFKKYIFTCLHLLPDQVQKVFFTRFRIPSLFLYRITF